MEYLLIIPAIGFINYLVFRVGFRYGSHRAYNAIHQHCHQVSGEYFNGKWITGESEPETVAVFYYDLGISDAMEEMAGFCAEQSGREYKRIFAEVLLNKGVSHGAAANLANALSEEEMQSMVAGKGE